MVLLTVIVQLVKSLSYSWSADNTRTMNAGPALIIFSCDNDWWQLWPILQYSIRTYNTTLCHRVISSCINNVPAIPWSLHAAVQYDKIMLKAQLVKVNHQCVHNTLLTPELYLLGRERWEKSPQGTPLMWSDLTSGHTVNCTQRGHYGQCCTSNMDHFTYNKSL